LRSRTAPDVLILTVPEAAAVIRRFDASKPDFPDATRRFGSQETQEMIARQEAHSRTVRNLTDEELVARVGGRFMLYGVWCEAEKT
jgi:hypothetical protein